MDSGSGSTKQHEQLLHNILQQIEGTEKEQQLLTLLQKLASLGSGDSSVWDDASKLVLNPGSSRAPPAPPGPPPAPPPPPPPLPSVLTGGSGANGDGDGTDHLNPNSFAAQLSLKSRNLQVKIRIRKTKPRHHGGGLNRLHSAKTADVIENSDKGHSAAAAPANAPHQDENDGNFGGVKRPKLRTFPWKKVAKISIDNRETIWSRVGWKRTVKMNYQQLEELFAQQSSSTISSTISTASGAASNNGYNTTIGGGNGGSIGSPYGGGNGSSPGNGYSCVTIGHSGIGMNVLSSCGDPALNSPSSPFTNESRSLERKPAKIETVNLLSPKRSLNLNIFLKQFKSGVDDLLVHIVKVRGSEIGTEELRGLIKVLPQADEVINCYKLRIESMLLREEFDGIISSSSAALQSIIQGATLLKNSTNLHEILLLVLNVGNYLNSGSYGGNAIGFKMSSLWKIVEIRANKPSMNLLHFVAQEAETQNKDLLKLPEELSSLQKTTAVTTESIRGDVKQLKSKMGYVRGELAENDASRTMPDISAFLTNGMTEIGGLEEQLKTVEGLRRELAEFFCEDNTASFKLEDAFKLFYTFSLRLNTAIQENTARREREERSKQNREQRQKMLLHRRSLRCKELGAAEWGGSAASLSAAYFNDNNNNNNHHNFNNNHNVESPSNSIDCLLRGLNNNNNTSGGFGSGTQRMRMKRTSFRRSGSGTRRRGHLEDIQFCSSSMMENDEENSRTRSLSSRPSSSSWRDRIGMSLVVETTTDGGERIRSGLDIPKSSSSGSRTWANNENTQLTNSSNNPPMMKSRPRSLWIQTLEQQQNSQSANNIHIHHSPLSSAPPSTSKNDMNLEDLVNTLVEEHASGGFHGRRRDDINGRQFNSFEGSSRHPSTVLGPRRSNSISSSLATTIDAGTQEREAEHQPPTSEETVEPAKFCIVRRLSTTSSGSSGHPLMVQSQSFSSGEGSYQGGERLNGEQFSRLRREGGSLAEKPTDIDEAMAECEHAKVEIDRMGKIVEAEGRSVVEFNSTAAAVEVNKYRRSLTPAKAGQTKPERETNAPKTLMLLETNETDTEDHLTPGKIDSVGTEQGEGDDSELTSEDAATSSEEMAIYETTTPAAVKTKTSACDLEEFDEDEQEEEEGQASSSSFSGSIFGDHATTTAAEDDDGHPDRGLSFGGINKGNDSGIDDAASSCNSSSSPLEDNRDEDVVGDIDVVLDVVNGATTIQSGGENVEEDSGEPVYEDIRLLRAATNTTKQQQFQRPPQPPPSPPSPSKATPASIKTSLLHINNNNNNNQRNRLNQPTPAQPIRRNNNNTDKQSILKTNNLKQSETVAKKKKNSNNPTTIKPAVLKKSSMTAARTTVSSSRSASNMTERKATQLPPSRSFCSSTINRTYRSNPNPSNSTASSTTTASNGVDRSRTNGRKVGELQPSRSVKTMLSSGGGTQSAAAKSIRRMASATAAAAAQNASNVRQTPLLRPGAAVQQQSKIQPKFTSSPSPPVIKTTAKTPPKSRIINPMIKSSSSSSKTSASSRNLAAQTQTQTQKPSLRSSSSPFLKRSQSSINKFPTSSSNTPRLSGSNKVRPQSSAEVGTGKTKNQPQPSPPKPPPITSTLPKRFERLLSPPKQARLAVAQKQATKAAAAAAAAVAAASTLKSRQSASKTTIRSTP